jgi:hypothetical protein
LFFTKSGNLSEFIDFTADFIRLGVAFAETLSNSDAN